MEHAENMTKSPPFTVHVKKWKFFRSPSWPCEQVLIASKGLLSLLMANLSKINGLHEYLGRIKLQNGGIGAFTDIFNF